MLYGILLQKNERHREALEEYRIAEELSP